MERLEGQAYSILNEVPDLTTFHLLLVGLEGGLLWFWGSVG